MAIVAVLVGALLGQLGATYLGTEIRGVVTAPSARAVDAAGGAVVGVVAVLLVAYILGLAVVQSPLTGIARQVRTSSVLGRLSARVVPETASGLFSGFQNILDSSGFPRVFSGLQEPTLPVQAPDPRCCKRRVAESRQLVKVLGTARSCRRQVEGTGFVYAEERVMTNAHVVAGVNEPTVILGDGDEALRARVVGFDPGRDVAVLLVPGLDAAPLSFSSASPADEAVVAGYPESGPFTAVPARVRGETRARGNDIYNSGTVVRDLLAVHDSATGQLRRTAARAGRLGVRRHLRGIRRRSVDQVRVDGRRGSADRHDSGDRER